MVDRRMVRSSNGEKQDRFVISAQFCFGKSCWNGQLTLANRRSMAFPLLIGRRTLRRGFLVNSLRLERTKRTLQAQYFAGLGKNDPHMLNATDGL